MKREPWTLLRMRYASLSPNLALREHHSSSFEPFNSEACVVESNMFPMKLKSPPKIQSLLGRELWRACKRSACSIEVLGAYVEAALKESNTPWIDAQTKVPCWKGPQSSMVKSGWIRRAKPPLPLLGLEVIW